MLGTIRFRITAIATVAVVAVLSGAGIFLVAAMRQRLTENLEDTIRRESRRIVALAQRDGLTDPVPASGDDLVVQVTEPDGAVVAATADLRAAPPIGVAPEGGADTRWQSVDELPGRNEAFRVLTRRVDAPSGPLVVGVAGALDDVRESTDALRRLLLVTVPLVTALLAALVWWLVGRTLRPVESIRAEVAGLDGSDLSRRVPEPPGTDEIAELARTMNAMLARVEDAQVRQRRFVADASHELRSPLARMRSELEVDRDHPETADTAATRESALQEIGRLQRMLDDLLLLARTDAGVTTARRDPVDLDDLVLREAERVRAETTLTVDASAVSAAQVVGDRDALGRLVRNLTDNAARHARSTITLSLAEHDGSAVLAVADDGPGIPAGDRERVFDRFTRLDGARTATTGGTGLGLAIVRDIVERHGGRVAVDDAPSGGARFRVVLASPRAP